MRRLQSCAVMVLGFTVLASAAIAQEATRPDLLFRESWRLPQHEGEPDDFNRRLTPEVAGNNSLELHHYGPDSQAIIAWEHQGRLDLWTGMATSPVAVTLRDKRSYIDLTGLARVRWIVRTNSIFTLYPVVRLADGRYLAGRKPITTDGQFIQVEIAYGGMQWYEFDPEKVVVLSEVKNPDLSRIDELGLVTFAPGGGHGEAGSANFSTVEVYANAVPR